MKRILAIVMTIFLLASVLCVTAVPVSAGGFTVSVCGIGNDGLVWAVGVYDNFEEAWNEAIYYATHLEEAWNSAERYESEYDRPAVEGFSRILVDFYDDWNADGNGSFGSGIGFKDGAIYVPSDAKIEVNLGGHTINRGSTDGEAVFIDAGADVDIYNGSIIGGVHMDKKTKPTISNIKIGDTVENGNASTRYASIFGEGSLSMIVAILALVASVAAVGISVSSNKKKAVPEATCKDEE